MIWGYPYFWKHPNGPVKTKMACQTKKTPGKDCKMFPTPTLEAVGVFNGKVFGRRWFSWKQKTLQCFNGYFFQKQQRAQQFQLYVPKSPRHQPGVTCDYVDLPGRNVVGKGNSSKGHWEYDSRRLIQKDKACIKIKTKWCPAALI